MVTTLYLIRHGETEGAETKRYKGSIDIPLSGRGIRQMEEISSFIGRYLTHPSSSKYMSYLREIHKSEDHSGRNEGSRLSFPEPQKPEISGLKAVYCSPLIRALKSAEIISQPYSVTPVPMPDLRERGFGIWEGMTFTEIKKKYPAEFEAWATDPLKFSPVEGESTTEVKARILPCLSKILETHDGEDIAVVAHGGVNRIILCDILGMPLENIFRVEQDYAAVNIIEFWDKYPVVKLMNYRP